MTDLSRFKKLMDDFVLAVKKAAPKKRHEIKARKLIIDNYWRVNPRSVVEMFYEKMKDFDEHIRNRKEEFFLNDLNIEKEVAGGDFIHALYLKEIWEKGLSERSKDSFWQYLQALYGLAKKIHKPVIANAEIK